MLWGMKGTDSVHPHRSLVARRNALLNVVSHAVSVALRGPAGDDHASKLLRSAPTLAAAVRARRRGLATMALALPLLLAACSPQPDDSSADAAGAAPSAAPSASSCPSASGEGTDETTGCTDDAYDYVALEMEDMHVRR